MIENQTSDNDIVLTFNKGLIDIFLGFSIFFIIATLFVIFMPSSNKDNSAGIIAMLIIMLISLILAYFYYKNKKIVISNDRISVFNIFGKKVDYEIANIEKIVDHPMPNGTYTVYSKDNRKFGIEYYMDNIGQFREFIVNKIPIESKSKTNHPTW